MELRLRRPDWHSARECFLTPRFKQSTRVPYVAKLLSLTELCGLLVKVTTLQNDIYNAKTASTLHSRSASSYAPRRVVCWYAHPSGVRGSPRTTNLSAAAAEVNTL
jgi:hypothetical protein